ncbi:helix-turn-helix transcriptional regulator [Parahaliea mediterranea]|uniref:helix-turn-helix transcriptional regulator n=1 Tax=Parahaliea mediterranea TaxID=651086 RepID=UPI0013003720|nr:helix-turn-helix transcriptional regulator [Parahaliea mediterranea]
MRLGTTLKKYDELLQLAYDGSSGPEPWKAFVECFRDVLEARDASIVIQQVPGDNALPRENRYLLVTSDTSPHLTREYLDSVMEANIVMALPQPQPTTIRDILPDELFLGSRLYQDFLEPVDIKHLMGMDIYRSDSLCIKLSVERSGSQEAFSEDDKAIFRMIAPHLQRALRFRSEVDGGLQLQTFYEHILDKMEVGVLLLDEQGKVISSNGSARALLKQGSCLKIANGRLVTVEPSDCGRLRDAFNLAASASKTQCRAQPGVCIGLRNGDDGSVIEAVVKPYLGEEFATRGNRPSVAVFLHANQPSGAPVDSEILTDVYGFTRKEAAVAALIGAGHSLNQVADDLSVSVNTVKTHLRGIYEKTGFHRQSQVVALLSNSSVKLL